MSDENNTGTTTSSNVIGEIAKSQESIAAVTQQLHAHAAAQAEDNSGVIEFSDFEKIDLRAGTIRSAERVPKSELLKLDVSFGDEIGNRTILARIGTSYTPEAVTGRQIIAVVNLAPRKMKGIDSHGMLLAAKRSDGVLALAQLFGSVPDGAQVG